MMEKHVMRKMDEVYMNMAVSIGVEHEFDRDKLYYLNGMYRGFRKGMVFLEDYKDGKIRKIPVAEVYSILEDRYPPWRRK